MAEQQPHSARWLLLKDPPRDGFTHMAVDVTMVKLLSRPALRLYTWQPWAVSLGHHQRVSDLDFDRISADGIDVVRRPTGGRAVLHAEELTYCVTLPASHPWNRESVEQVYRWISEALASGLRHLNLPVTAAPRQPGQEKGYFKHAACFAQSVRFEIDLYGKKLVGSAQRRFPEGILQHGSILIGPAHRRLSRYFRRSRMEPHGRDQLPAISLQEALQRDIAADEVAQAVVMGFEQVLGVTFEPFQPTASWQENVEALRTRFLREMQEARNHVKENASASPAGTSPKRREFDAMQRSPSADHGKTGRAPGHGK